jgi:hypothetical protein
MFPDWPPSDKFDSFEEIELGAVDGWSHASIDVAMVPDGTWRNGHDFSCRGCGSAIGPSIKYGRQFATRQEAFDDQVSHAIIFFRERLQAAEEGCWSAAGVRKDSLVILQQIEERTMPQQMDMFAT